MRILLIEDDKKQKESLIKTIEKNYIDIKTYDAETVMEAEKIVKEKKIDLFLVDINLPDGSGLEFAKRVREMQQYKLTGIVFLTTQVVQIIDAFKNTHCYDFLIKPYTVDEIKRIIDIFYEEFTSVPVKECNSFIVALENGVSAKIYEDDIIFVEYSQRKCCFYTNKGKIQSKAMSLAKLMKSIKSENIVQAHKSYVVNTRYINKIEKVYPKIWDIHFTIIDEVAQLSNSYKDDVFARWEE